MTVAVAAMSETEARDLTAQAYEAGQSFLSLVQELYVRGAHKALGYRSFATYFEAEFNGMDLPRIATQARPEVVRRLSAAGMSTREAAAVAGVHFTTVAADLKAQGVGNPTDPPKPSPPTDLISADDLSALNVPRAEEEPIDAVIVEEYEPAEKQLPTPFERIAHDRIDALSLIQRIRFHTIHESEDARAEALDALDEIIGTARETREKIQNA